MTAVPRAAVAAVAQQQTAGATVPSRSPVRPVTDQRPTPQSQGGSVDHIQQARDRRLQRCRAYRLDTGIRAGSRVQGKHELVVKEGRPRAEGLKSVAMSAEQGRKGGGDLVGGSGQHVRRGRRRNRTRRGDGGPDARQLRGRGRQLRRGRDDQRHRVPPHGSANGSYRDPYAPSGALGGRGWAQVACKTSGGPGSGDSGTFSRCISQPAMLWNSGAAEWPGLPSALRSGLSIISPIT
ncbi:hypothetical protein LAUMK4_03132 [Mycobacterium persicum]|uniref:Uncharacterized protein n=1 Tax=Mycobacterium persicum TaxID=1487726 RepID=A0AB38UVB6_9MYCO|nr:hypothetical protein LAUMK15_03442 [Mycobacterium persicum]VAZ84363.1 hypothetical protein LAUMK42_03184 [Mycobacterium persicum]VAZ95382.1 hypothetical protein LAUMK4_03132 [Mycobacterium persicum]